MKENNYIYRETLLKLYFQVYCRYFQFVIYNEWLYEDYNVTFSRITVFNPPMKTDN